MVSKAIRSLGYDKQRAVLQIEMDDGRVYDYVGVPQAEFEMLLNADSIGEYYSLIIKPNYPQCYLVSESEFAD